MRICTRWLVFLLAWVCAPNLFARAAQDEAQDFIQVRVMHAFSDAAIEGATVRFSAKGKKPTEVVTDSLGLVGFRLSDIDSVDAAWLKVSARGFVSQNMRIDPKRGKPIYIACTPSSSVHVAARIDPSTKWARADIYRMNSIGAWDGSFRSGDARTYATGTPGGFAGEFTFTFEGLSPGSYRVSIANQDDLPVAETGTIEIKPGHGRAYKVDATSEFTEAWTQFALEVPDDKVAGDLYFKNQLELKSATKPFQYEWTYSEGELAIRGVPFHDIVCTIGMVDHGERLVRLSRDGAKRNSIAIPRCETVELQLEYADGSPVVVAGVSTGAARGSRSILDEQLWSKESSTFMVPEHATWLYVYVITLDPDSTARFEMPLELAERGGATLRVQLPLSPGPWDGWQRSVVVRSIGHEFDGRQIGTLPTVSYYAEDPQGVVLGSGTATLGVEFEVTCPIAPHAVWIEIEGVPTRIQADILNLNQVTEVWLAQ